MMTRPVKRNDQNWQKIWEWAQNVYNIHPNWLVGDIRYYRRLEDVVVYIPIQHESFSELDTYAVVRILDDGRIEFELRNCNSFLKDMSYNDFSEHLTVLRQFLDGQQYKLDSDLYNLYFVFTNRMYQPEWQCYPIVEFCLGLNFYTNRFYFACWFKDCDENYDILGEMLWKTISGNLTPSLTVIEDGGDTDEGKATE